MTANSSYPPIVLKSAARTSVGQVRENNEDSVHLWASEHFALAIVADGMGGAAAGEEASRLAVEAVANGLVTAENRSRDYLQSLTSDFIISKLREAVRTGNHNILTRAQEDPDLRGMGTTTTLAFVRYDQAVVAHVGDSRAYLVQEHGSSITQVTADHSFVEALVAAGQITPQQAEDHPMRHVLYRALGQSDDLDVDVYTVRLYPGDRLVLCSDGLTRHVHPAEIGQIALVDAEPGAVCDTLIQLANSRGGEDNISVVVIRIEADPAAPAGQRPPTQRSIALEDEDTMRLTGQDLSSARSLIDEDAPTEP